MKISDVGLMNVLIITKNCPSAAEKSSFFELDYCIISMSSGTDIRVVDNATLKAVYGAYSASDITSKSTVADITSVMKAGNLETNNYMVDTITELAYLDFITPEKIQAKNRPVIDAAFSKDRKGAINMCLHLYKGKTGNPASAKNFMEKINSIAAK